MMHAQSKGDPSTWLCTMLSNPIPITTTSGLGQVAPGCVAGPENWVYCSDDEWARYFGQYSYFKRKLLRTQQEELTRDPKLSKLISRIDRQLADKTIHFDRSDGSLRLDRKYYALWDSAESHGLCSSHQSRTGLGSVCLRPSLPLRHLLDACKVPSCDPQTTISIKRTTSFDFFLPFLSLSRVPSGVSK